MRTLPIALLLALALLSGCGEAPYVAPAVTPVGIGGTAPNLTQSDTAGKSVSLSDFRGKVVLLDFWATWCQPCRNAIPGLKATLNRFRDRDFAIVSVTLDDDLGAWRSFIAQNSMDWTHLTDGKGQANAAVSLYSLSSIPMTYLIDKNGKIIAAGSYIDGRDDLIEEALR